MEIWANIKDFSNYYISNTGRVKCPTCIMKPNKDKDGYLQISFSKGKFKKTFKVHRLVGIYFIPNPSCLPEINHLDFDKTNNHFSNLEWTTNKENVRHAAKAGKLGTGNHFGENNGRSKINQIIANEIKNNLILSRKELAKKYNVSSSTIDRIKSNKSWNKI